MNTTKQKPKMVYNRPRFTVMQYDWDVFKGPRAGEPAIDFAFTDFNGDQVSISDFVGRWLVIESGSATCSMYTKNMPGMKKLRAQHPDVEFLVVYVREAHPGERLHQHHTFDDKMNAAKSLVRKYDEDRIILVDQLLGKFHITYGAMPNIVYVINPEGIVHYRCNWATTDGLAEALADRENINTNEHADMHKLKASRGLWIAVRTMWTGGLLALWDFVVALPKLAKRHKLVDEYYAKHGKFKQQPGNQSQGTKQ